MPLLEPHKASYSIKPLFPFPYAYKVMIHEGCVCNEYDSLVKRHLVNKNACVNVHLWKRVTAETMRFYDVNLVPWSYSKVIESIKPSKRKVYIAALDKITTFGLFNRASVKMFVKPDKYPIDVIYEKAPRAIQYRNPEFNLVFMKYIKPIEEWAYPNLHYGVVSKTRVMMKGLNQHDRAALFMEKMTYFKDPVFIVLDHNAFDSTITEHHLKSTHRKYAKIMGGAQLRWACHQQIYNKGRSRHGIRYKVVGTRMSGDADTALGNCIVNADAIYGVLMLSGVSKYDYFLDGDDSVIILERGDRRALNLGYFYELGLLTKIEETDDFRKVDFCQCRVVESSRGPVFCRNPIRALSRLIITTRRFPRKKYKELLCAIGICENSMYGDLPVYNGLARALIDGPAYWMEEDRRRMEGYRESRVIKPVSLLSRNSFAEAWGISLEMQQWIEEELTYASVSLRTEDVESLQRTRWLWELGHESSSGGWWDRC